VYVGAIFFGVFARAHFGELGDPEQALPLAVSQFLPSVLGGFVIAAIVAAICSTADSQLIVVSSTLSRDVFGWDKRHHGKEGQAQFERLDRITLVILGILSVVLALTKDRTIFEFVLYNWGVMGAAFGPVVILGLLWPRATRRGALAGMIVGTVVAIGWKEITALSSVLYELVPAFFTAMLAIVVVSLLDPEGKKQ
ncbi:MAG: sodium/proline symporter, partial [Candidatus Zixiibacteriota bacterium]